MLQRDVFVSEAGFFGDVGEGAVAIIVQEHVVSPESDEEIGEAVVIVIAGADALAPSGERDTGFLGDVGESAVAIIVIEVAGGFLALGETFEGAAVD